MGLQESMRIAVEGLRANKMRALLTMLGIIIGIAAVIGILTVGNSLTGTVTGQMSSFGASSISISLQQRESQSDNSMTGTMGTTPEAKDLISEKMITEMVSRYPDEIAAVSLSESAGSGKVKDGRLYANISATGVNTGYFSVNEVNMLGGRVLAEKDIEGRRNVCMVSDKLVNNLFGENTESALGSTITADLGNEQVRLRVIGVYEYEASAFGGTTASEKDITTTVYIPVSTAKYITRAEEGYSSVTVMAAATADGTALAERLEKFLERYYRSNADYTISAFSMESMIETVDSIMGTLSTAISVIAAISLLVGGIGVMNIMLVSVTERTREIGTRKALGATNKDIRVQFVTESMIICLIGGVIGILVGTILGYVGSTLLGEAGFPTIGSIALAVGFSLAVGVFFGYYPANKAANLDPIEALRYDG